MLHHSCVLSVAGEPIESRDDEGVALSDSRESLFETVAGHSLAGEAVVLVDALRLDAEPGKRLELRV